MAQGLPGIIDPSIETGTALAADLNIWQLSIQSNHSGVARPTYLTAGGTWVKEVSGTVRELYLFDGTLDVKIATSNQTTGTITVNSSIIKDILTVPPGSPVLGDSYIVGAGATGAWVGEDGKLATWDGTAWQFVAATGNTIFVDDNGKVYVVKATGQVVPFEAGGGGAGGGWVNKLINSNFDVWQRAVSQTATGYGSDDRWTNDHVGSAKTHSQQAFVNGQTDVPGNPRYYSRTVVTAVASAGNYTLKAQKIESVRTFAGQSIAISFYAKASVALNLAVEAVQNFGTGGTPSSPVTGIGSQQIALTTSWQKFELTIAVPSISGKTIGTNDDDNLQLNLWFEAGSTFDARTDTLGHQSGTFDLAQVQLEDGATATTYQTQPYETVLEQCLRYFAITHTGMYASSGSSAMRVIWHFKRMMRATPTLTPAAGSLYTALERSGPDLGSWYRAGGAAAILLGTTADAEL